MGSSLERKVYAFSGMMDRMVLLRDFHAIFADFSLGMAGL